jgi:hypothetical protein
MGRKRNFTAAGEQVADHPYHDGAGRVVPNPQRHEIETRCYPKANNKDRGKPRLSVLRVQERNKITQEHWRG